MYIFPAASFPMEPIPTNLVANLAACPVPDQVSSVGCVLLSPNVVAPLLPVSQKFSLPSAHGFQTFPTLFQSSKLPLGSSAALPVINVISFPVKSPDTARHT